MTPEFSRAVRIDTLGSEPRSLSVVADEPERAALARRFDLPRIDSLSADLTLMRSGEAVTAQGRLRASLVQSCVATEVDVPAKVDEPFTILFRPHPRTDAEEEIELSEGEMDIVFYEGSSIDVGEAIAETLALSLDPFPRSPEAEAALKEAGVLSEEEAKPPSAFAGLKDLLEGKS